MPKVEIHNSGARIFHQSSRERARRAESLRDRERIGQLESRLDKFQQAIEILVREAPPAVRAAALNVLNRR